MSREIKFRAWDKNNEEIVTFERMESFKRLVIDAGLDSEHFMLLPKHKNTILMQYTGLKDKEGTEIYEGDILDNKAKRYFGGMLRVYYSDTSNTPFIGPLSNTWNEFIHGYDLDNCEVIGNIYENKDLLNK